MKRRSFIINSGLITGSLMVPEFLKASGLTNTQNREKCLVVIQLSGGNDGLNTIIPYQNDIYYNLRPRLALKKEDYSTLSDKYGINSALDALKPLYDNGEWSIINGVGYPNPNRSHFRSMDIWQSASGSENNWNTGWIGRYLDNYCGGCANPLDAIEIGSELNLALKGKTINGLVMDNPESFFKQVNDPFLKHLNANHEAQHGHHDHEEVDYLYKTLRSTYESADYLLEKSKVQKTNADYPFHKITKQFKTVADLIISGNRSKIYYISISGFDTHVNQKNQQGRLLKQYAESVTAFINHLKVNDCWKNTMVFTFSEFGRRVKQNASGGTDHGTANNVFVMAPNLKKAGFYNDIPSLSDLDDGDLKYKIDFRRVYASILQNWLKTNPELVLQSSFTPLNFI